MKKAILALLLLTPVPQAGAVVCNLLDYEIRIENCAGEETDFESNLNRACRRHPGETLAKCRRNCVSRNKAGVCQECGWKQVSAAACTDTGDRMKLRKCSEEQTAFTAAALKTAKALMQMLKIQLSVAAALPHSDGQGEKFKQAAHKADRIIAWLNKDRKFLCKGENGLCKGSALAAAYPLTGGAVAVRLCDSFFNTGVEYAAGTLIHEASHSCCGTTDKVYFDRSRQPRSSDNWHNIADTYFYWTVYGFCTPGSSVCE